MSANNLWAKGSERERDRDWLRARERKEPVTARGTEGERLNEENSETRRFNSGRIYVLKETFINDTSHALDCFASKHHKEYTRITLGARRL